MSAAKYLGQRKAIIMFVRSFNCIDCGKQYEVEYKTEIGAQNAHRLRCPECQKLRKKEFNKKRGSQNVFKEVKTENSTLSVSKNGVQTPEKEETKRNHPSKVFLQQSPSLLGSMGKRISILAAQKTDKESLENALAYGRQYRKKESE